MSTASRGNLHSGLSWLAFGLAVASFTWFWLPYRDYWIDDAFITFRYARNLAEGFGPVYNPGEFVEGYTSFLWMLASAVPFALTSESGALLALAWSGWVFGVCILYRVFTFPDPDGPARRISVLLLATYPLFVINCGDGLETPLFMLLLVELARAMVTPPSRASGMRVGLLTAAMTLTRPESLPLLVALPLVHLYALRADAAPASRAEFKAWLVAFLVSGLLPVLVHEAWRWLYYGQPLPNTYYAKATGSQLVRLKRGCRDLSMFFYWSPWVRPVTLWLSLLLAGLVQWVLIGRGGVRVRRWSCVLWLMLFFRVSFDLWSGGEAMGDSRFITPMLIPLVIVADLGIRVLWKGGARFLILIGFVGALGFNVIGNANHVAKTWSYREGLERGHIALGRWLREHYPEDSLVAMGDAGATPFFSRMRVIDLWGLNNAVIAHMPGEYGARQGVGDLVLSRDPDVVVIWNLRPFYEGGQARVRGAQSFDRQIVSHPDFQRRYRFAREFVFAEQVGERAGYYLTVFERRQGEATR